MLFAVQGSLLTITYLIVCGLNPILNEVNDKMIKLNEGWFLRTKLQICDNEFSWQDSKIPPLPYCSSPPTKDDLCFYQPTPFIMSSPSWIATNLSCTSLLTIYKSSKDVSLIIQMWFMTNLPMSRFKKKLN